MKTWTTIDKSEWGDGPWQKEPDKMVWVDEDTDLDCMIHRGSSGALCGYVGVPKGHPWYGVDYNDYQGERYETDLVINVDVHGGLTFSSACQETDDESSGICHVPEPGREHDIWWLGFDCAHMGDVTPELDMRTRQVAKEMPGFVADVPDSPLFHRTYKTVAYVMGEIHNLAQQAQDATADAS